MASIHCFIQNTFSSPLITLRRLFNLPGLINTPRSSSPIGACLNVDISPKNNVEMGEKTKALMEEEARVIVRTYAGTPVVLSHGKGSKLFDVEGREYLDMTSGIAVNALGHSDPDWVRALVHVSNIFYSLPMVDLAKRLVSSSFNDNVFLQTLEQKQMKLLLNFQENSNDMHAKM